MGNWFSRQDLEESSSFQGNGQYTWRLEGISDKIAQSKKGGIHCLRSPDFYIEPQQYKYHLELYPNGSGQGKDTHMSIRLVPLVGRYDAALTWPPNFNLKVRLVDLYGGFRHLEYIVGPDDTGVFIQPHWEKFVVQGMINQPHSFYVKDDLVFINVTKVESRVPTRLAGCSCVAFN